ncbi:MAG: LytR C-terminal domain-containing protein [Candidatus Nanopelagicales bacterium]
MTDEHAYPFPWRLMAAVAAVVIAATVMAGLIVARNRVAVQVPTEASVFAPAPDLLPVEERRQVTLLIQVRDADGGTVSNALLAAGGGTGFVAELILPRDLLLPTVPPVRLEAVSGPAGPVGAQGPLEALLGVQIDATLALDRLAWVGLLDSLGGAVDPSRALVPSSFPLMLDRIVASLPRDRDALGQLLTSLGSMAQTSVTNDDAAYVLSVLVAGTASQPTRREPVAVARQPDADAAVRRLFPKALLQPGHAGPLRVVVERGGATLGAAASARRALAESGYGAVLWSALPGPAATTEVLVPDPSTEAAARGREVAAALGLPLAAVAVSGSPDPTVDVRVVLGADFRVE